MSPHFERNTLRAFLRQVEEGRVSHQGATIKIIQWLDEDYILKPNHQNI